MKPNLQIKSSLLKVRNAELLGDKKTYLTSPCNASATLTVQNITGAALSGYVIMGEIGSEKCELKQIHAATSPTGFTITLSSATTNNHPTDTVIYFIDYNQVEFSRATSSGGAKSVLSTATITPDQEFTQYQDTNTTGYGYARFKNSATTSYSSYSDEQAYANLAYNSIATIINRVFRKANEIGEGFITRAEVLDYIWSFIDDVEDLKAQWKFEEADQDSSNSLTIGGEEFNLPTDIKLTDPRSITNIRMEGYEPLTYISPSEWARKIAGLERSTLDGAVLSGATTIDLIDGSQFSDSGDGYIAGDAFSWTGKTDNQLTGVTGVLAHDSGAVVYGVDSLGAPEFYTIQNGQGRLYPAPSEDYDGFTLIQDYYKRLTHPDSENDLLPIPYVSPCVDHCLMSVNDKKGDKGANEATKYERRYTAKITRIIKADRPARNQTMGTKE